MRIALLCATRRGLRFLERLAELAPEAELVVFSFREEAYEPPFFDAIREAANARGGRFFESRHVGEEKLRSFWETAEVDLAFVVSWRYLIPPEVYRRPRRGTFVFHDSLLPEYRGFAPTVWALVNGEDHTGVTLFEIAEEMDAGPVVDQKRVPIAPLETIAEVLGRVTGTYLDLLERNLPCLLAGTAPRMPQDHERATYTCRRVPDDNRIDWNQPASAIHNLVRAVSEPYPGAFTDLDGRRLTIWAARPLPGWRR